LSLAREVARREILLDPEVHEGESVLRHLDHHPRVAVEPLEKPPYVEHGVLLAPDAIDFTSEPLLDLAARQVIAPLFGVQPMRERLQDADRLRDLARRLSARLHPPVEQDLQAFVIKVGATARDLLLSKDEDAEQGEEQRRRDQRLHPQADLA